MTRRLTVFGLGLYSELAHHYFEASGEHRVEAFTVDAEFLETDTFLGLPVLAWDEARKAYPCTTHEMFVGIGYSRRNLVRKEKFLRAREAGYRLPSYVHPSASVAAGVRLGANCLVREQAVVGPFSTIGDDVFVGTQACVSHHAHVRDHAYLGPAATVCGSVDVGEACFVGADATLRDGLRIGEGCLIGAGALILSDCEAGGTYPAVPTRRATSAGRRGPGG